MENREIVLDIPVEHERNIFGGLDLFLKKIERSLQVDVIARDGKVKILGSDSQTKKAERVLQELLELSKRGSEITEQNVDYIISMTMQEATESYADLDKEILGYTVQGKPIKAKTYGQQKYVRAIQEKMMVFGIGPAGTGKTYLAMAMAIQAFKNNEVTKIILTRPAIEAGENLGFLPGDLQSKIDPYLRPLYDALYQIMGAESFIKNSEKGLIEVAPLAYMRGRTLDNAFIILDEAQNTTPAQMKMFLTISRINRHNKYHGHFVKNRHDNINPCVRADGNSCLFAMVNDLINRICQILTRLCVYCDPICSIRCKTLNIADWVSNH